MDAMSWIWNDLVMERLSKRDIDTLSYSYSSRSDRSLDAAEHERGFLVLVVSRPLRNTFAVGIAPFDKIQQRVLNLLRQRACPGQVEIPEHACVRPALEVIEDKRQLNAMASPHQRHLRSPREVIQENAAPGSRQVAGKTSRRLTEDFVGRELD